MVSFDTDSHDALQTLLWLYEFMCFGGGVAL